MRRAVITLTGTVVGLAALLSFKTHSALVADGTPAAPQVTSSGAALPTGAAQAASTAKAIPNGAPSKATSTAPPATSSAASTSPSAAASPKASSAAVSSRVITGTVANTQYGPMQVQLTVTGTKITKAVAVQQTNTGAESTQIDANAIPQLNQEVITAQSAKIDAVSGASFTSMGYIQSLQSAVDQIG